MKEAFKAVEVAKNLYWVGAIDWAVRDFHGYLTARGTTYNAYLILDEKITLVDTVKAPFADELLGRIASLIDPERIDYIISNHSEPDHAGSLQTLISTIRPEKIFASKMGCKALSQLYSLDSVTPVSDGEKISLGEMDVTFLETRMAHWPDSMVSYLHQGKLLFSQDAFGMHLASPERFTDQIDPRLLEAEAAKYYANILLPLSNFVAKALGKIQELRLEFDVIAPDHGPIWRKDPMGIVDKYARWARQERVNKAVVVYDTMWDSTDLMARAVSEGLSAAGTPNKVFSMRSSHRSDVASELLDAAALIVGSPTINKQMFPSMADVLNYLTGLRPKGLVGGVFGSHGWSGEATGQLRDALGRMNAEMVEDPVKVTYRPTGADLQRCYELGLKVAQSIQDRQAAV